MLNIALPKGRLGSDAYNLFVEIGYAAGGIDDNGRKLVFEEGNLRFLLVKPSDVPVYVERGAADIGVAGKDVLLESGVDVYELLDLRIGACRLALAAPHGWTDDNTTPLRVATKYPAVTRRYFDRLNRRIEIIKLGGSIELAPGLGLSDVILDIVETGRTLRENNLTVYEIAAESSARLIANKSSYGFNTTAIDEICSKLRCNL